MEKLLKTVGWTVGLSFITFIMLGFMALTGTGFAIVNDGYRGVMKTGTEYEMVAVKPGYHFFIPVYQTMEIKTVRPILINYSVSEFSKTDSELLQYEKALKGLDGKGIPISLALTVEIRPNGTELPAMYKNDGDFESSWAKKVLQANREAVQTTISHFSADTIMDKRAEVEKMLTDLLNKSYSKNEYFTLVDTKLKDILVPQKIRDAQLQVQIAKQDALRSEQLIKKAQNEAKSVAAKAQGEANSKVIQAKGIADAILVQAKAQAQANKLVSASLTEKILRNNAIQKWNGVKSRVQAGDSGLIIDLGTVSK